MSAIHRRTNSFLVVYVLGGNQRVRQFRTEDQMIRWIEKFNAENGPDFEDSWLDFTVNQVQGGITEYRQRINLVGEY